MKLVVALLAAFGASVADVSSGLSNRKEIENCTPQAFENIWTHMMQGKYNSESMIYAPHLLHQSLTSHASSFTCFSVL